MIGQRLRDLREDADITQEQLGKVISLSNHAISSFELDKNEPKDEIKIKIAQFFKVSVDYLLGLTDDPKPTWDKSASYIRLPIDFPLEAIKEAENYVKYLAQEYNGRKHSNDC